MTTTLTPDLPAARRALYATRDDAPVPPATPSPAMMHAARVYRARTHAIALARWHAQGQPPAVAQEAAA